MVDENQDTGSLTQPTASGADPGSSFETSAPSEMPPPANTPPAPPSQPEHKGIPPWVWIVATIVVVAVLLGWYYTTQTEQGHLWILGLRSMSVVPNVVGQTQSTAQTSLSAAGFRVGQVSQEQTLAVPPGVITSQTPPAGTEAKKDSGVNVAVAAIPTVKVDNVVGQSQSDAITMLAEQGLRTGTTTYAYDSKVSAGDVTAQQPSAGTETTVGSAVGLTVSKGQQQGQVPNVVGLSQDDANSVITADGFKVTTVKSSSANVPAGNVMTQSPAAGVVAPSGSTVTITVSTGAPAPAATTPPPSSTPTSPAAPTTPPPSNQQPSTGKPSTLPAPTTQVPDVVGLGVIDAVTTLRKAQLKVSFAFGPSDTNVLKVASQDPSAGSTATPGDTVTITIGLPSFSLPGGQPTQPTPPPAQKPAATPQPAPTPSPQPTPAPKPTPTPAPSIPST